MLALYKRPLSAAFLAVFYLAFGINVNAQSGGSSTSVTGTVADPTGAVVANAVVEIRNPVSGFERTASTDAAGKFTIPNVPFNPYHLTVAGPGFSPYAQDVDVRSVVPVNVNITLQVKGSAESVTVEAEGGVPVGKHFDFPH
jgi:Carboxypeptidase regulatory-like domain